MKMTLTWLLLLGVGVAKNEQREGRQMWTPQQPHYVVLPEPMPQRFQDSAAPSYGPRQNYMHPSYSVQEPNVEGEDTHQPNLPIFYMLPSKVVSENQLIKLGLFTQRLPEGSSRRSSLRTRYTYPPQQADVDLYGDYPIADGGHTIIPRREYPPYYPTQIGGSYPPYGEVPYYQQRPDRYDGYPPNYSQKKKKRPPSSEHYYQEQYYPERQQYYRPSKPTKQHRPSSSYAEDQYEASHYGPGGYQPQYFPQSSSSSHNRKKPRPELERFYKTPYINLNIRDQSAAIPFINYNHQSLAHNSRRPSLMYGHYAEHTQDGGAEATEGEEDVEQSSVPHFLASQMNAHQHANKQILIQELHKQTNTHDTYPIADTLDEDIKSPSIVRPPVELEADTDVNSPHGGSPYQFEDMSISDFVHNKKSTTAKTPFNIHASTLVKPPRDSSQNPFEEAILLAFAQRRNTTTAKTPVEIQASTFVKPPRGNSQNPFEEAILLAFAQRRNTTFKTPVEIETNRNVNKPNGGSLVSSYVHRKQSTKIRTPVQIEANTQVNNPYDGSSNPFENIHVSTYLQKKQSMKLRKPVQIEAHRHRVQPVESAEILGYKPNRPHVQPVESSLRPNSAQAIGEPDITASLLQPTKPELSFVNDNLPIRGADAGYDPSLDPSQSTLERRPGIPTIPFKPPSPQTQPSFPPKRPTTFTTTTAKYRNNFPTSTQDEEENAKHTSPVLQPASLDVSFVNAPSLDQSQSTLERRPGIPTIPFKPPSPQTQPSFPPKRPATFATVKPHSDKITKHTQDEQENEKHTSPVFQPASLDVRFVNYPSLDPPQSTLERRPGIPTIPFKPPSPQTQPSFPPKRPTTFATVQPHSDKITKHTQDEQENEKHTSPVFQPASLDVRFVNDPSLDPPQSTSEKGPAIPTLAAGEIAPSGHSATFPVKKPSIFMTTPGTKADVHAHPNRPHVQPIEHSELIGEKQTPSPTNKVPESGLLAQLASNAQGPNINVAAFSQNKNKPNKTPGKNPLAAKPTPPANPNEHAEVGVISPIPTNKVPESGLLAQLASNAQGPNINVAAFSQNKNKPTKNPGKNPFAVKPTPPVNPNEHAEVGVITPIPTNKVPESGLLAQLASNAQGPNINVAAFSQNKNKPMKNPSKNPFAAKPTPPVNQKDEEGEKPTQTLSPTNEIQESSLPAHVASIVPDPEIKLETVSHGKDNATKNPAHNSFTLKPTPPGNPDNDEILTSSTHPLPVNPQLPSTNLTFATLGNGSEKPSLMPEYPLDMVKPAASESAAPIETGTPVVSSRPVEPLLKDSRVRSKPRNPAAATSVVDNGEGVKSDISQNHKTGSPEVRVQHPNIPSELSVGTKPKKTLHSLLDTISHFHDRIEIESRVSDDDIVLPVKEKLDVSIDDSASRLTDLPHNNEPLLNNQGIPVALDINVKPILNVSPKFKETATLSVGEETHEAHDSLDVKAQPSRRFVYPYGFQGNLPAARYAPMYHPTPL